jgi:hypothetical protein
MKLKPASSRELAVSLSQLTLHCSLIIISLLVIGHFVTLVRTMKTGMLQYPCLECTRYCKYLELDWTRARSLLRLADRFRPLKFNKAVCANCKQQNDSRWQWYTISSLQREMNLETYIDITCIRIYLNLAMIIYTSRLAA